VGLYKFLKEYIAVDGELGDEEHLVMPILYSALVSYVRDFLLYDLTFSLTIDWSCYIFLTHWRIRNYIPLYWGRIQLDNLSRM
jgi:hypothetical protein